MRTGAAIRTLAALLVLPVCARAQDTTSPVNAPIGSYETIAEWARLPDGQRLGAAAGVEIDPDGKSVWVADRCGQNSCVTMPERNMVFKFNADGTLARSWGAGLLVTPHGMFVEPDGSVWVTDMGENPEKTKGHSVTKFSPDGKVLMTLGTPGKSGGAPGQFNMP